MLFCFFLLSLTKISITLHLENKLTQMHRIFIATVEYIIVFASLYVTSCSYDRVSEALHMAGENRGELEHILEYFEQTGDKEKIAASRFLIGNMPGHKSMRGSYEAYWYDADRILSASGESLSVLDSLENLKAKYDGLIYYDFDLKYISADYLIHDIETAFDQWRNGEWARHLSFDEFCEWLLPYTCSDSQPLMNWRDSISDFAKGYIDHLNECDEYIGNPRAAIVRVNNKLIPMISEQKWIHSGHGYPIYNPSIFVKLPGASCNEYMINGMLIMRSKGIPIGMDYTPQFADRMYGHYWNVYPNLRGRKTMFTSFGVNPDYPHYTHTTFAKIVRQTYSSNNEYLKLLRRHNGDIPHMYDSPFFKDVTDEYQETTDVCVELMKGMRLSSRDAFICVFGDDGWEPVSWGKARFGKVKFLNMGRRTTYLVLGYVGGVLKPVSYPFFLDDFGRVSYIGKEENLGRASFTLYRKYPMFQHVMLVQSSLHGGLIIGADDRSFKNADTVCVFPEWQITSGKVTAKQKYPHRYWRFLSNMGLRSDMAELFFYDNACSRVKISADSDSLSYVIDGDPLTYYSAYLEEPSGVLDTGEPVILDHVSYIRRGDGNAIVPGDLYRVSWWNGKGWTEHCESVANDVELQIEDIPANKLYFVEGLSRGVQNRTFIYEKKVG